jgi:hypothetical protein
MRLTLKTMTVLLLATIVASAQSKQKKTVCQLVSPEEIASLAHSGPVEVDADASGPIDDSSNAEACSWKPKGGRGTIIEMGVQEAENPVAAFAAHKAEAYGASPQPSPVQGLGDEALYRDFEHARGGALLLRSGKRIFWCSGGAPKDSYIALAKLILKRW